MPKRTAKREVLADSDVEPSLHREFEIKFSGDPEALESIFAGPTLASLAQGRAKTKQLENVYYDTPELDLRRQGVAFRVRKDGRRFEQTVKAEDGASTMFGRPEWQTKLASPEPVLDGLPAQVADAGQLAELRPLFTTRYRRKIKRLDTGKNGAAGAIIEAAFDVGQIETDRASQPIAELELELIDGRPEQLYELALVLEKLAPVRLESRSKSARGYLLATGAAPSWHKADALQLDPEATVAEAMATIFGACFRHWLANKAAAIDGSDPEGVHQLRVGLRRLRSALTVFRTVLPAEQREWLTRDAKALIGQFAAARDWDVFLAEILPPVCEARQGDAALQRLRATGEERRAAGYDAARAELDGATYTDFVLRFGRWLEGRGWLEGAEGEAAEILRSPIVAFADQLLKKRQKSALKRGHDFAELTPPERHQLRIALKKLRYTAEFFSSLYKAKRSRNYLKHLKQLQDDLGHLNDIAVTERLLAEALEHAKGNRSELQRAAGLVVGWYACRVGDFEPGLLDRWTRFATTTPFWH